MYCNHGNYKYNVKDLYLINIDITHFYLFYRHLYKINYYIYLHSILCVIRGLLDIKIVTLDIELHINISEIIRRFGVMLQINTVYKEIRQNCSLLRYLCILRTGFSP